MKKVGTNSEKQARSRLISPDFLSMIKEPEPDGSSGSDDDSNYTGFFRPYDIKGFLAILANEPEVRNAMSIFQFTPQGSDYVDDNGTITKLDFDNENPVLKECLGDDREIIRIDTGELFDIQKPCQCFRKLIGRIHCSRMDSRVALFASGDLKSNVEKFNVSLKDGDLSKIEILHGHKDRSYIKYTCPHSCLDEYIFPILFEGKTVACLILGQVNHENYDPDKAFSAYRDIIQKKKREEKFQTDFLEKLNQNPFDENDLRKKIELVCKQIKHFEKRIEKEVELSGHRYIDRTFETITEDLQKNLHSIDTSEIALAITEFKSHVTSSLKEICDAFRPDLEFIRMFAIDNNKFEKPFSFFAASNECQNSYKFKLDKDLFLKEFFSDSAHTGIKELTGRQRDEVVNKFSHQGQIDNDDSITLLPTLSGNVSFIIWRRKNNHYDKKTEKLFKDKLSDFYILVSQIYATLAEVEREKILTNIIRIAGHEVAQIVPSLIEFTNRFAKTEASRTSETIKSEKFKKDLEDLKGRVLLMKDIYDKPKMAFGMVSLQDRTPEHLSDILVQGAKLYRPLASDRCISIPAPDEFAKRIWVDVNKELFGHIINNLLDNAVKYSYEGTNIYVETYEEEGKLVISVISYGDFIEEGGRIYDLYYRGEKQKDKGQGLGVGMFLSRRIAAAHGFQISHKPSEKLSDYHMSALAGRYYEYPSLYFDLRLSSLQLLDEVVSTKDGKAWYTPSRTEAKFLLEKDAYPTCRNHFYITIPSEYYTKR